jgi:hypothetical protein
VERLDETWTELCSLPAALDNPYVAAVNGRLFVFGGWSDGDQFCKELHELEDNVWIQRQPMPDVCWFGGCTVMNGSIFVTGGGVGLGRSMRYDVCTDSWIILSQPNTVHYFASATEWGGRIIVFWRR